MAKDFREYLVESSRHETFGRFFKELSIGIKLMASFQASNSHSSEPVETLDDLTKYTKWEVALRQVKPIDLPKIGAWDELREKEWAKPFDRPEYQRAMVGEFIPSEHCQQILEDCIAYAIAHNQMESEDDIRLIEPDEDIKKSSGCGRCGSKKPAPAPTE